MRVGTGQPLVEESDPLVLISTSEGLFESISERSTLTLKSPTTSLQKLQKNNGTVSEI